MYTGESKNHTSSYAAKQEIAVSDATILQRCNNNIEKQNDQIIQLTHKLREINDRLMGTEAETKSSGPHESPKDSGGMLFLTDRLLDYQGYLIGELETQIRRLTVI